METLVFFAIFIFFTLIGLLLLLQKRKTIEIIILHLILMLASIVIGATQMFSYDALLTTVFMLMSVTMFIGNVLMVEA